MAQEQILKREVVAWARPCQDRRGQKPEEFEHVFSIADLRSSEVVPPHNGLDSSHAAALDTARYQGAGPARVLARSAVTAAGLDTLMASPSQSNADNNGDTVYDPFVGSGMTPAVAAGLVPQHPSAAA